MIKPFFLSSSAFCHARDFDNIDMTQNFYDLHYLKLGDEWRKVLYNSTIPKGLTISDIDLISYHSSVEFCKVLPCASEQEIENIFCNVPILYDFRCYNFRFLSNRIRNFFH